MGQLKQRSSIKLGNGGNEAACNLCSGLMRLAMLQGNLGGDEVGIAV